MNKIISILFLILSTYLFSHGQKCALPNTALAVKGSKVCEGVGGTISIALSQIGVTYTPYIMGFFNKYEVAGKPVKGTGDTITLIISARVLKLGNNGIPVVAVNVCKDSVTLASKNSVVIVDQRPTIASAADISVCNANSTALHGNSPSIGTGYWSLLSGSGKAIFRNSNDSLTDIVNLNFGTPLGLTSVTWNIKNGVCPLSTDTVNISNWAPVTDAYAGPDQFNLCSNSAELNADVPKLGTGYWSLEKGERGIISTLTDPKSKITGLATGSTTILYWTVKNGLCSKQDTIKLSVPRIALTGANAGKDTNICENEIQLYANSFVGSAERGVWKVISGKGEFKDSLSPNSTVYNLSTGANVLQWTISNKNCSSSSVVTINVFEGVTQALTEKELAVCSDIAQIKGNKPLSYEKGTWELIDCCASFDMDSISYPILNFKFSDGPKATFRWTISNGACKPTSSDITVTRYYPPTQADAGLDDSICGGSTTLSANNPDSETETGVWSLATGNVTDYIRSTGDPNAQVNKLPEGITKFIWSIKNPGCPASQDTVQIRSDLPPTVAIVGPDQQICSRFTIVAGNKPTKGIGRWSSSDPTGAVFFDKPDNAITAVSGLSVGTNILTWTVSNGVCPSTPADVKITVMDQLDEPNAGPAQLICANATTLSAKPLTSGKGHWSTINGGTILSPDTNVTKVRNLKVNAYNTFYWTVTLGDCKSKVDSVKVYVRGGLTPADAGSDTSLCEETKFILRGNVPGLKEKGTWSSPFNTAISFSNSNLYTTQVNGLPLGKTILQYTITTSDTGCVGSTDEIIIDVKSKLTQVFAGPDQDICGSSATLSGYNPSAGEKGVWTASQRKTSFVDFSKFDTQVNDLIPGKNILTWSVSNGACPVVSKSLTINSTPSLGTMGDLFANDSTICKGGTIALIAPEGFLKYKWYLDNSLIYSGNSSNIFFAQDSGSYSVEGFTVDGCYSLSDPLIIFGDNYNSAPQKFDLILTGSTVCETSPISLKTDFNETLNYQWFVEGINIVKANDYIYVPVIAGNYFVMYRSQQSVCSNITDTVRVNNKKFTSPPEITGPAISVDDINIQPELSASSNGNYPGGQYQWYAESKTTIPARRLLIVGATSDTYKPLYNGKYYVSVKYNDNCFVMSAPYVLTRPDYIDIERANVEITDSTIAIASDINSEILISPNPTEGYFTLDYRSETNNDITIEVYNSIGLVMDSRSFKKETDVILEKYDATSYVPGVYLLKVKDGVRQLTSKIVIH